MDFRTEACTNSSWKLLYLLIQFFFDWLCRLDLRVACNDEWCHPCKRTPPLRTTTLFVCSTSNESAPAMRLADGVLLFSIPSFGSALTLDISFPSSVVAVLNLINARYSISISLSLKEIRGQFNKVYFTSRTLVFTNSHQFKFTKSLYKFPLETSTCTYNGILLDQSVVSRKSTSALCSCKKKKYTCTFFIELVPALLKVWVLHLVARRLFPKCRMQFCHSSAVSFQSETKSTVKSLEEDTNWPQWLKAAWPLDTEWRPKKETFVGRLRI